MLGNVTLGLKQKIYTPEEVGSMVLLSSDLCFLHRFTILCHAMHPCQQSRPFWKHCFITTPALCVKTLQMECKCGILIIKLWWQKQSTYQLFTRYSVRRKAWQPCSKTFCAQLNILYFVLNILLQTYFSIRNFTVACMEYYILVRFCNGNGGSSNKVEILDLKNCGR